jgi:hypothetical protein
VTVDALAADLDLVDRFGVARDTGDAHMMPDQRNPVRA